MRSPRWHRLVLVLALVSGACSSGTSGDVDPGALANETCDFDVEELVNGDLGVLTVATSQPAPEPWYQDGNPTNGEGYESAVVYEVAEKLGVAPDFVAWLPKDAAALRDWDPEVFDLAVDQLSADEVDGADVTVSRPYLEANHALVAPTGRAAPDSLAEVRDLRLSAVRGMMGYDAVLGLLDPSTDPLTPADLESALDAATDGTVDAVLLDLVTAWDIAEGRAGWEILAQFPTTGDGPELRTVVGDASGMKPCIDDALDELAADGTLAELQQEWLVEAVSVPMLTE